MARYIDADKLIAHLKDELKECPNDEYRFPVSYGCRLGLMGAIAFAETLSMEDAVPRAEVALALLSDLKIEAHNKAVHPCGCKIDAYISLKDLDGIIQKYINEYYEEGKKNEN